MLTDVLVFLMYFMVTFTVIQIIIVTATILNKAAKGLNDKND